MSDRFIWSISGNEPKEGAEEIDNALVYQYTTEQIEEMSKEMKDDVKATMFSLWWVRLNTFNKIMNSELRLLLNTLFESIDDQDIPRQIKIIHKLDKLADELEYSTTMITEEELKILKANAADHYFLNNNNK